MSNTTTKSQARSKTNLHTKLSDKKINKFKSSEAQLQTWAHEGTRESLNKIIGFIKHTKDKELKAYAEIALSEASFFYYSPNTESEETDFLTAKMVQKKERNNEDLVYKIEAGKLELDRLKIDKKVTEKLFKTKKINEECVYRYCVDFTTLAKGRVEELKEELEYNNDWIEAARYLIKNKKYTSIPYDVLDSFHLDGEDDICWMNDFMEPEEE